MFFYPSLSLVNYALAHSFTVQIPYARNDQHVCSSIHLFHWHTASSHLYAVQILYARIDQSLSLIPFSCTLCCSSPICSPHRLCKNNLSFIPVASKLWNRILLSAWAPSFTVNTSRWGAAGHLIKGTSSLLESLSRSSDYFFFP